MRIAINAADLDHNRIDGTRIYIQNILNNFGLLDREDQFLIYHKNNLNSELKFNVFENYKIKKLPFPFWWTQTRFAFEMFKERPEVLWMPMHAMPRFRPRKTKTVVTIHDLAFKFYPQFFPRNDLWRLNAFTDYVVKNANKLIAVSNSTKKDLLKVYPHVKEERIKVIYHGYDKKLFSEDRNDAEAKKTLKKYGIENEKYLITVGSIQPRKNLGMLVDAFLELKKTEELKSYKLVVAGGPAWQSNEIIGKLNASPDIITTGNFATRELPHLFKGAEFFVMPSLYEGFGLPLLEAMACGVPTVASNNSSLKEILQDDNALFKGENAHELACKLRDLLKNDKIKALIRERGLERAKTFSWEKSSEETLEWLKS